MQKNHTIPEQSQTVLSAIQFSEITDADLESAEFEVLKTGKCYDPRYGTFEVTETMLANMVKNFNSNILGVDIAIDKNHEWADGAVAWVKTLRTQGGKLYATFKDFTDEGKRLFKEKIFKYFSVEFAPFEKVDEEGNMITIADVLRGIACTNRPVIKGMKPAFYSESLHFNTYRMDKFLKFAEDMLAKGKTSKDELNQLKGMFAMLSEEEQAEAQPKVEAVEATVEPEEEQKQPSEEELKKAEEEKAAQEKQLAEKALSLAEFNRLAEENTSLKKELRGKQLAEKFKGEMMLSEARPVGFQGADEEAVTSFMASLSESQLAQFSAVLGKVAHVQLGAIGSTEKAAAKVEFSEDAVVERAATLLSEGKAKDIYEAQKLALAEFNQ